MNQKGSVENDDPKTLAENLYKQNIEIAGKNKILSLLSKLYKISVLTLTPKDLAIRVSETIQIELSFELVGILLFSTQDSEFKPLAFALSQRLNSVRAEFSDYFGALKLG